MIKNNIRKVLQAIFEWPEGVQVVRTTKRDGVVVDKVLMVGSRRDYYFRGQHIVSWDPDTGTLDFISVPGTFLRPSSNKRNNSSVYRRLQEIFSLYWGMAPYDVRHRRKRCGLYNKFILVHLLPSTVAEFVSSNEDNLELINKGYDYCRDDIPEVYVGAVLRFPISFKDFAPIVSLEERIREIVMKESKRPVGLDMGRVWRQVISLVCAIWVFGIPTPVQEVEDLVSVVCTDLRFSGEI